MYIIYCCWGVFFLLFVGNKVQVRCVRLLKPYSKKSVDDDDDDDDEDDEDYNGEGRAIPPMGRIMEHDVLSQAYHIGKHIDWPCNLPTKTFVRSPIFGGFGCSLKVCYHLLF